MAQLIELRHIVKRFPVGGAEVTVLDDVSLSIGAGEFVAIVGPSGNGKSTLLNMLTGIDRPTSGEVVVGNRPIHTLSEDQLATWRAAEVGIVFQFFQMLPALSLLQNVMLPMEFHGFLPRPTRRERAAALLTMVGLAEQMDKLPGTVSGGEQQRAAIARALANNPALLVADEPTGNLDAATSETVFAIFEQVVAQGKTVVMVTHSPDLAARATRRVVVRSGRIVEDSR